MIPRTFSLARLLFVVTLASLICGLIFNYPIVFTDPIIAFLVWTAVATTLVLARLTRNRALLIFNSAVGAVFGFASMPLLGPSPFGLCCVDSFGDWAMVFPALGALLFGGVFLLAERFDVRSALANPKSQI